MINILKHPKLLWKLNILKSTPKIQEILLQKYEESWIVVCVAGLLIHNSTSLRHFQLILQMQIPYHQK